MEVVYTPFASNETATEDLLADIFTSDPRKSEKQELAKVKINIPIQGYITVQQTINLNTDEQTITTLLDSIKAGQSLNNLEIANRRIDGSKNLTIADNAADILTVEVQCSVADKLSSDGSKPTIMYALAIADVVSTDESISIFAKVKRLLRQENSKYKERIKAYLKAKILKNI